MKGRPNVILSPTDVAVLEFLWRWKVSTTALLARILYGSRKPQRAYKRLINLEAAGYIESKVEARERKSVWTLTKKGFEAIRGRLPELKDEGFKSECPGHDLLVAAVQLGDGAFHECDGLRLVTEQELRRLERHEKPTWVPRSDYRRPDGYWCRGIGDRQAVIALEVELSEKSPEDYSAIDIFYRDQNGVSVVLWVVRTPAAALRVESGLNARPHSSQKHNFILAGDISASGWSAKIIRGNNAGKTVRELLGYAEGTDEIPVPKQFHLNVLKSPHHSKTSLVYEPGDFFI